MTGRPSTITVEQREEFWRRYKAGESVLGIIGALRQRPGNINRVLEASGGIAPVPRRRCQRVLRFGEREEISRGLAAGDSFRVIAMRLHRAVSTVSQEVARHGGRRRYRRSRHATYRGQGRGAIIDAVSIRERPAEAEDRAVPGHWEGDLVEGSRGTYIATLVERQSRFVMLVKLSEKGTEAVVEALIKAVRKLPTALRKSLTWDRGSELASHVAFTVATDVQVYFCDPSSPWQRGSNENTNGLLRQYYPKGKDLSTVSQAQLDTVARKLNTRPRETLNWKTPAYILESSVSMTS